MGLDMHLQKEIYIGAKYKHKNVEMDINIKINGQEVKINKNKIKTITEDIGYWRKANQIHKWFEDNLAEGEINNGVDYDVSIEQLNELKELCELVLDKKQLAPKLLPVSCGFFFGSDEFDEYYFEQLESTIEIINNLNKDFDYHTDSIVYSASW